MQAKELKKIFIDLQPFRNDLIPSMEDIVFLPGEIGIRTDRHSLIYKFDHEVTGVADFNGLKKLVSVLDDKEDFDFKSLEDNKVSCLINGKVQAKFHLDGVEEVVKAPNQEDADINLFMGNVSEELKLQLSEALNFVSNDQLRPAMTEIGISSNIIAATDGHMLYMDTVQDFGNDSNIPMSYTDYYDEKPKFKNWDFFMIPLTVAKFLIKQKEQVKAEIFTGPAHTNKDGIKTYNTIYWKFSGENFELIQKMMDEKFPDVKAVWPDQENRNHSQFIVDQKELIKSLKMADVMANATTHQVEFNFTSKPNSLVLKAEDLDFVREFSRKVQGTRVFHQREEVKVIEGEEQNDFVPAPAYINRIGFNARFLLKILSRFKADEVSIIMFAENRAAIIQEKYLVMPVMLNNYV